LSYSADRGHVLSSSFLGGVDRGPVIGKQIHHERPRGAWIMNGLASAVFGGFVAMMLSGCGTPAVGDEQVGDAQQASCGGAVDTYWSGTTGFGDWTAPYQTSCSGFVKVEVDSLGADGDSSMDGVQWNYGGSPGTSQACAAATVSSSLYVWNSSTMTWVFNQTRYAHGSYSGGNCTSPSVLFEVADGTLANGSSYQFESWAATCGGFHVTCSVNANCCSNNCSAGLCTTGKSSQVEITGAIRETQ
jgi:hypothetical protein